MSTGELELRRALTQADFDHFAALSGDDNPIHVDPEFSARTRFGRTVSHGVLLVTVLRGLAERLAPGAALDRHEVRFPAPTFADEPMVFRVWREGDGAIRFSATRDHDDLVTCDGRFLLPLREKVAAERPDEGSIALSAEGSRVSGSESAVLPLAPPLRGDTLPRGERVGDSAETSRTFNQGHVADYVALGGEHPPPGRLPAPLVSALFSYLLGVKLPGPGANYLKQETEFVAPARVGEQLTARVEVTRLRPEKSLVDLATTCHGADGRLIATGRALIFVGDVA